MSGIAGIAHRHGVGPAGTDVVERMCAAMRHRGPEHRGLHAAGPVALGVQRLGIIDPGGNQPVFNEDRTKAIVFNGEIYNYRELRAELIGRGHVFRTDGDTETVLHLYEELGAGCMDRLRGMFAFAIWDANARTLFLARDRFGIKPLYLARGPWGLAFASELKALLAAGVATASLDWEALDVYFQLGYIPAPSTPFRGVKKLEPGHTLLWSESGEITIRRYWDLPEESSEPPRDLEDQVLAWLDESVAAHMVSDVPVAAFLSGGLDSSAVLASMTMSGQRAHAFTARYAGSGAGGADETVLAAAVADRYGAELTVVDIQPDITSILENIVYALDEPHADDSAIPAWALSQAVAGSYKVALTGIGGDELFAGYWRHIGGSLGPGSPRAARARGLLPTGDAHFADRFLSYVTCIPTDARRALYAAPFRNGIGGGGAQSRLRNLFLRGGCRGGVAGGQYLDYKTILPDDTLALGDRIGMAHSIEIRTPLVDHRLVEQIFRLPDRTKVRWCMKKLLLRRAMRSRLTREHLRAPKRGFVAPTAAWLRNELKPMLQDELSTERIRRLGFFDETAIGRLMNEHFQGRENHERSLWALLSFSIWHRLFVETPAPQRYAPAEDPVNLRSATAPRTALR